MRKVRDGKAVHFFGNLEVFKHLFLLEQQLEGGFTRLGFLQEEPYAVILAPDEADAIKNPSKSWTTWW